MCGAALLLGVVGWARADDATPAYPAMASFEQYRVPNASEEIALSRTAAPASISGDAGVLTLGDHGYETRVKGKNGFVCLVQRSWAAGFEDTEFWNPKLRAPICFNPAAARTVLPAYLERTEWVIAGASKADMMNRTRAELAANRIATPEPGAVAFMMSKQGYLGDAAGHWHPHLMFFLAHVKAADWGADLHGSPVLASAVDSDPITTFFVLVPTWSDGTPAGIEARSGTPLAAAPPRGDNHNNSWKLSYGSLSAFRREKPVECPVGSRPFEYLAHGPREEGCYQVTRAAERRLRNRGTRAQASNTALLQRVTRRQVRNDHYIEERRLDGRRDCRHGGGGGNAGYK
jgi:hypothetical protein